MTFVPFPSGTVITYAGATIPSGWMLCNGSTYSIADYPDLYASLSLTQSITTNATTTVTTSSTETLAVGALVVASGVPSGAYITSITNATTFVISAAATASATVSATFRQYDRQIDPTTGSAYAQPSAGTFRVPDYRGLFLRGVGTPSGKDAARLGDRQVEKTATNGLSGTAAGQTQGVSNISLASGSAGGQSLGTSNISLGSGSAGSGGVDHSHSINSYKNNADSGQHLIAATGNTTNFSSSAGTNSASAFNHTHGVSGSTNITHTHGASVVTGTTDIAHTHAASALSISGDNETRPLNKGINYIIKV